MDVEDALDDLYSQPLESFTSLRNAIAKAVKDAKDDDSAARVKALKKPSVAAWTINQLVRQHPREMKKLLSVRDRLEGAGSSQELRDLSRERRDLVAKLARLARDILERSDHGASHQTLEKVSQGLLAGGTEDERAAMEKGRLTREPSSSGLEALGFDVAATEPADAAPAVSLKTQREVQKLRREAERLQQEAAGLEQEAAFAEEHARRAREKADRAAAAADAARTVADAAAEEAGL